MRPHERIPLWWRALCAAQLLAAVALGAKPALAIDFEKLVMPGEVIRAHADVEKECSKCHAPFRAEAQNDLCIECHREAGEDLRAGTGFHGRAPGASTASCSSCHAEHEGRDADVVGLDPGGFDHDLSDYPLRGAHRRVPCARCHEPDRPLREAPGRCNDCHRDDDPHRAQLGTDCVTCHVEQSWSEARFDHDSTKFPLEGEHWDVACALCHPGERYVNTVRDCHGCHRLNDSHLGRFGERCETCHSAHRWKPSHFDHDRDTHFPLAGSHRNARCEGCHEQGIRQQRQSTGCVSCHRADDVHRGHNGRDCERCHSEMIWKTDNFDHGRTTKFPLRGAHGNVKCQRCHMGVLGQEKLDTSCYACHRDDDVHRRQQGQACGECHNERGWTAQVFFEHDLARFPLLGQHAVAACEQCHATPRFKDARTACVSCHDDDDVHLRRLGPACADCHNPNAWNLWRFDHEGQAGFALHGAHGGLDCHECHRTSISEQIHLSRSCFGCHANDDRHFGSFGRDCTRCHTERSWAEVELNR
jgi:hypothetical protein